MTDYIFWPIRTLWLERNENIMTSVWNNRPHDRPIRTTFGTGEQICLYERPTGRGYFLSQVYIISGSGF